MPKKLIEVALPLEAINKASAREKSIRHGHPSTLHLWWARRPLATARAVIWASLVDDPSAHPDQFPTVEAQKQERDRLFGILTDLVQWENSNNEEVLNEAKAEIMKSTGGHPPELLDPFAGGGSIPLEAQRLGLKAHAHDLNPVAVTINRAMIEIPPRFAGRSPVNPEARANCLNNDHWPNAAGLAEDVRYYGEKLKELAWQKIGHLYPKVKLPARMGGDEATVIAWIWARTVRCPNPACGCEMPLVSTYNLSKKKGNEAYIIPHVINHKIRFEIKYGKNTESFSPKVGRGAIFVCPACGGTTTDAYVKEHAKAGQIGNLLMAIVAEGKHGRVYLSPQTDQEKIAKVPKPKGYPDGTLPQNPRWFSPPAFGFATYSSLFTNRQLTALTTFCDCLPEVERQAERDALAAGCAADGKGLAEGGSGAKAYGEAIKVYLSFVIDKMADLGNALDRWEPVAQCPRQLFARQAIPMVWDFAESNPFSNSSGSWDILMHNLHECLENGLFDFGRDIEGKVCQSNAENDCGLRNGMVSTDPPYYDNIGYADLSDFFYIWLRKNLKDVYPKDFSTMLVPKAEELVATPYRFDGSKKEAKDFFEDGMFQACKQLVKYTDPEIPVTIYYAFKQKETDGKNRTSSTGWETMLSAIIRAGFSITGTWPMRTEMGSRAGARNANSLASSIVLVCRKRPADAPVCTKREFMMQLKKELKTALAGLKSANIAPVDLAQSAIGPGIGVFSRYGKVLEANGSPVTVRTALYLINDEIDAYFHEQDTGLDRESRFCVDLYTQSAFNEIQYGEADVLARAKNTSVDIMVQEGILQSGKNRVRLLTREELPKYRPQSQPLWLSAQQMTRAMETDGVEGAAEIVAGMVGAEPEGARDLVYRLFTIADKKNCAREALAYNNLIVAWQDIIGKAAELKKNATVEQLSFDLTGGVRKP